MAPLLARIADPTSKRSWGAGAEPRFFYPYYSPAGADGHSLELARKSAATRRALQKHDWLGAAGNAA